MVLKKNEFNENDYKNRQKIRVRKGFWKKSLAERVTNIVNKGKM